MTIIVTIVLYCWISCQNSTKLSLNSSVTQEFSKVYVCSISVLECWLKVQRFWKLWWSLYLATPWLWSSHLMAIIVESFLFPSPYAELLVNTTLDLLSNHVGVKSWWWNALYMTEWRNAIHMILQIFMGFTSFKLSMKRTEMDFTPARFSLCCKYIRFDVGSCTVYEKSIPTIMWWCHLFSSFL